MKSGRTSGVFPWARHGVVWRTWRIQRRRDGAPRGRVCRWHRCHPQAVAPSWLNHGHGEQEGGWDPTASPDPSHCWAEAG